MPVIATLADVQQIWNGPAVLAQVQANLGKGLKAGAIFLVARTKELISVPAPRVRVLGKRGKMAGVYYYRATTKATPGAPPRKLSGRLRTSETWDIQSVMMPTWGAKGLTLKEDVGMPSPLVARAGSNVIYARRHEKGTHPYMVPALQQNASRLVQVIGSA